MEMQRPYANEEKALYLQQEKKLSLGFSDGVLATVTKYQKLLVLKDGKFKIKAFARLCASKH